MAVDAPFDQGVTFIYCKDMAETTRFYEELIGLPRVLDQTGCRLWRVSADTFLGACERPVEARDGLTLTFVTEDVDGVCARLRERGVAFEKEPQKNEEYNIYHAFLRDPSGYLVEIQRFDQPEWPKKK